MSTLSGKSILVTGGASGIGAATSELLVSLGASVTIADLNDDAGGELAKRLSDGAGGAQFVHTDIADEDQVAAAVTTAESAYGALHGASNNAAIPPHTSAANGTFLTADLPRSAVERSLAVNVVGTFLCLKYEIAACLRAGGGSIVNTSSANGLIALPAAADYVAGKHAIIGLTKAAALDYATQGIRVNAVLPGVIKTPMLYGAGPADDPSFVDNFIPAMPIGRLGESSEVAEVIAFLLSDAASLMTGASVSVDGGQTMV